MNRLKPCRLGLLLLLVSCAGCAVDQQQEIQMGQQARGQFEKEFGGRYPDPEVQSYVNQVGMSLVRYSGRPDLPWEFAVLNSKQVNAFSLPGGFTYITQGLLFNLQDEAQLAGVLGHEIAHSAHRDAVKQLEQAQLLQGGLVVAGVLGGSGSSVADIGQIVAGLVSLQYSRDQERAADLSGLDYMAHASYDPHAMVQVMQTLDRLSKGSQPPEFLSNHPNPGNREEYLTQAIQQNYANVISTGKTGKERFQQNVAQHAH